MKKDDCDCIPEQAECIDLAIAERNEYGALQWRPREDTGAVSGARILLVEGVPGIGKSTVLALAQTHTYGPLAAGEDAGTLTRDQSLAHLERIVSWIEWLAEHAQGQNRTKCWQGQ